jgi:hypothetical protein
MRNTLLLQIAAPLMIDLNDQDAVDQVKKWFVGPRHPMAAVNDKFWQPVIVATNNSFNDTAALIADYHGKGVQWARSLLAEAIANRIRSQPSTMSGHLIDQLHDVRLSTWCIVELASNARWTFGMPSSLRKDIDTVRAMISIPSIFSMKRQLRAYSVEWNNAKSTEWAGSPYIPYRSGDRTAYVQLSEYVRKNYGTGTNVIDAFVWLRIVSRLRHLTFGAYGYDVLAYALMPPDGNEPHVSSSCVAFAYAFAFDSFLRDPPTTPEQLALMLQPGWEAAREVLISALFTYLE